MTERTEFIYFRQLLTFSFTESYKNPDSILECIKIYTADKVAEQCTNLKDVLNI